MLSFDQVFDKENIKFTKAQINNSLYKHGHITKFEKDYLDKKDREDSLSKNLQISKFNFLSFARSKLKNRKVSLKK